MTRKLLFLLLITSGFAVAQSPIVGYYGYINDELWTADGTGSRYYNRVVPPAPLDQSATGANLTWNFNELTVIGSSFYHNRLPTSGESAEFEGTTRVVDNEFTVNDVTSTSSAFLNGWAITGVANADFTLHYTDNGAFSPDTNLEYGDNYTESIGGTFFYDGYNGTFTGTITGTVDAYGTLNLDGAGFGATSDQVTRLKIVQSIELSYPPFGVVGTTEFTSYHYYRDGDLYPFFTSTLSDFNIPILTIDEEQTTYEAASPVILGTPELQQNRVVITPNPASNFVAITADGLTVQSVVIVDRNGRTVLKSVAANNIDVSSLSAGVYFVRVETDHGSLVKKIIKQ